MFVSLLSICIDLYIGICVLVGIKLFFTVGPQESECHYFGWYFRGSRSQAFPDNLKFPEV